jgi:hypothetical protein
MATKESKKAVEGEAAKPIFKTKFQRDLFLAFAAIAPSNDLAADYVDKESARINASKGKSSGGRSGTPPASTTT